MPVLTLYAFSRENWARSDDEVIGLFAPARAADPRARPPSCAAQGVRIRLLGRLDELPDDDARLDRATRSPRPPAATGSLLNIAFNYAGRTELVDAFRRLAASGVAARGDRRDGDLRRALHGRPARPRPRDPDRRRAAPLELPDLAVGLRRARTSSDVLWPDFGPDAFDAALARVRPPDTPLRTLSRAGRRCASGRSARPSSSRRCSSPSLLGGPWIVAGRRRRHGPRRARGLPAPARGRLPVPAVARDRPRGSRVVARRRVRRPRSSGSGLLLVAVGDRARRGRRLHPARPARRPADLGRHRLRRPLRRPARVHRSGSARGAGRARPARRSRALGAERGWILLLVLAVWAYDTGAYLVGRRFGRARFLTHISPSKTYAGLIGGIVAATVVVGVMLVGLGAGPVGSAPPRTARRRSPPRPATSPSRCSSGPPAPRTRAR